MTCTPVNGCTYTPCINSVRNSEEGELVPPERMYARQSNDTSVSKPCLHRDFDHYRSLTLAFCLQVAFRTRLERWSSTFMPYCTMHRQQEGQRPMPESIRPCCLDVHMLRLTVFTPTRDASTHSTLAEQSNLHTGPPQHAFQLSRYRQAHL